MLTLLPLLVVILIGSIIYVSTRSRNRLASTPPGTRLGAKTVASAETPTAPSLDAVSAAGEQIGDQVRELPRDVADDLARWASAGLLTARQALAIAAHEQVVLLPTKAAPPPPPAPIAPHVLKRRRIPLVAEALGYLGGMLAIIGLVLLVSRYWRDMGTPGRAVLSGGAAAALVGAGFLVREQVDPALASLRWFLWLLGTAATGLCAGVITRDGFDVHEARQVAMACSAAVAVLSGVLWWWRERPVQQVTCLAGIAVFIGATMTQVGGGILGGGILWVAGVVAIWAGLRKRTPLPIITGSVGAATLAASTILVIAEQQGVGLPFAIATGFVLLSLALVPGLASETTEQIVMAGVGGILLLQTIPSTLVHFADHAGLVTGLVVWVVGAALIAIGARALIRLPILAEVFGGLAIIGGAALTGTQYQGFAPLFGIATSIALVALGMIPGRVLMSVLGSLGLLINVPWAIGHFFPGAGRAPLLIMVSGALIIAVAVLLTRMSGRMRTELGGSRHGSASA